MCYLLIFHIALFVMAILCFVKGKLQISHNWVATGTPAYFAGVLMLLPFPLTVLVVVLVFLAMGLQGGIWHPEEVDRFEVGFFFLVLGVTTACVSAAFLIAMVYARDPEEVHREERRAEPDWDDEDRWDDRERPGRY